MCLFPQIDSRRRRLAGLLALGRGDGILFELEKGVVRDVVEIIIQEHVVLHLCGALVPCTSPCLWVQSSARRVSLHVSVNSRMIMACIGADHVDRRRIRVGLVRASLAALELHRRLPSALVVLARGTSSYSRAERGRLENTIPLPLWLAWSTLR